MSIGFEMQQEEQEDTLKGKYLTFSLGAEAYAVPIRYVIEINRVLQITPVPDFPSYVDGITNLRGKIIPIINLRRRLGLEVLDFTDTTCFMILSVEDAPFGLIVDSISEVVVIPDEDISPPPAESDFIAGVATIGSKISLVIDCENIFVR